MARQETKVLIACLCATAVLVVLITPAFDELPSTPANPLQHGVLPAAAAILLLPPLQIAVLYDPALLVHVASVHDLLSLNCTRLC